MAIRPTLHPLDRANGSATYNSPSGHSILAAVNGPVEVQRRDELLDEAHIEVNVRPSDGIGQVKERHLETIIARVLRNVVLVELFPRQMVQLTLQIVQAPVDDDAIGRTNPQAESVCPSFPLPRPLLLLNFADESLHQYLTVLPWLLNAACLALLDGAIPMRHIFTSTLLAVTPNGVVTKIASIKDIKAATSLHMLTFNSEGGLLAVESEGLFTMDEWDLVEGKARGLCIGDADAMADGERPERALLDDIKDALKEKIKKGHQG